MEQDHELEKPVQLATTKMQQPTRKIVQEMQSIEHCFTNSEYEIMIPIQESQVLGEQRSEVFYGH
jgi:hypothetical protein